MRQFITVTVLAGLLCTLVSCGQREDKIRIGVSIPAADHGWTAGVDYWAKKAMAEHPDIQWVYATALTPAKQTADIEDMFVQEVDAIVVLATESAPVTKVAERAKERGIYIVNVDRGFVKPVADVFLEGDNKAFGRKSAQFMAEKLGPGKKIVVLRGIPSTVDTDRFEAAKKVFEDKGITVLADQPGMWNREKALEVMQAMLQQFDDIDAVWAADDDMALGAEQAIREAGRADQMWIFGGAGMKNIVKRVMDGDTMYPADITYPPAMIAAGIHIAAGQMRGQDAEAIAKRLPPHLGLTADDLKVNPDADGQRHIKLDVHLITPENAKDYYFPDSVY